MTLFAVFIITPEGAQHQLPAAMFKDRFDAEKWAKTHDDRPPIWSSFKIKEIEIMKCDVVERTGLVWR